jgi:hypothetical protein
MRMIRDAVLTLCFDILLKNQKENKGEGSQSENRGPFLDVWL